MPRLRTKRSCARSAALQVREHGDSSLIEPCLCDPLSLLGGVSRYPHAVLACPNCSLALDVTEVLNDAGARTLLFHAIRENDHFLIQGIVFLVIVGLGLATLILDLCYPLMDPRISHRGGK